MISCKSFNIILTATLFYFNPDVQAVDPSPCRGSQEEAGPDLCNVALCLERPRPPPLGDKCMCTVYTCVFMCRKILLLSMATMRLDSLENKAVCSSVIQFIHAQSVRRCSGLPPLVRRTSCVCFVVVCWVLTLALSCVVRAETFSWEASSSRRSLRI